jgi:anti-sigma regulatory factor (Ser/Thr protein kinase)
MGTVAAMETARTGTDWFPMDDASSVGAYRRAAQQLASRLGFADGRGGEVAIVASEIAGNMHVHGRSGVAGLQIALRGGEPGVQLLAVDRGPGMADVLASARDGQTTSGTLGVGLGAVARLSDRMDVSSQPGYGTVLAARLWRTRGSSGSGAAVDVDGVTRPIEPGDACGDFVAARETAGRHVLLASDGLGHGPLAAAASQEALRIFLSSDSVEPASILAAIHQGISHTRGAAVAIASVDRDFGHVQLAGIGNISAFVCGPERRQAMISFPGIVGHNARAIRQLDYEVPAGSAIVLHSDGLRESWSLQEPPGLARRSAVVIAAALLRDHGSRRDDASVLVARRAA